MLILSSYCHISAKGSSTIVLDTAIQTTPLVYSGENNLTIKDNLFENISMTNAIGLTITNCRNITIQSNTFRNFTSSAFGIVRAIYISNSSDVHILSNEFFGHDSPDITHIYIKNSSSITIENNTFQDSASVSDTAIHILSSQTIRISNNTVNNLYPSIMLLEGNKDLTVDHNRMAHDFSLSIADSDGGGIFDNIFEGSSVSTTLMNIIDGDNLVIRNNIFTNHTNTESLMRIVRGNFLNITSNVLNFNSTDPSCIEYHQVSNSYIYNNTISGALYTHHYLRLVAKDAQIVIGESVSIYIQAFGQNFTSIVLSEANTGQVFYTSTFNTSLSHFVIIHPTGPVNFSLMMNDNSSITEIFSDIIYNVITNPSHDFVTAENGPSNRDIVLWLFSIVAGMMVIFVFLIIDWMLENDTKSPISLLQSLYRKSRNIGRHRSKEINLEDYDI